MLKELSHGPPITLLGKTGHLVTVIDDWGQFYTNVKACQHWHSLFRALQGHGKAKTWLSVAILL